MSCILPCYSSVICQHIAGLAFQFAANSLKRREADRPGLAGLEDREVGKREADPFAEVGQRHAARMQEVVEPDHDAGSFDGFGWGFGFGSHHTVPSRSSRIAAPWRNTQIGREHV